MVEKILLVEDNAVITKMVTEIVKKQGCTFKQASDGLSALNILDHYIPDVIFLDLILPKISGEMLCKIIRSKPQFQNTYIIILSGIATETDIDFPSLGVDACIAKGPNINKHINTIFSNIEEGTLSRQNYIKYGFEEVYARDTTIDLLNRNKHLELILNNLSEGLVELDADGKILFANPKAELLLSTKSNVLIGTNIYDLFPDNKPYLKTIISNQTQDELENIASDPIKVGNKYITLKPCRPKSDSPLYEFIIILDITSQLLAEEVIRKSEEHYRDLIENTTDLVQNLAPDGRIIYVNRAWKNTLGYSDNDIKNLTIGNIIAPEHHQKCKERFSDVISGKDLTDFETTFLSKDGKKVHVLGSANSRFDNNQLVYTRGIFRDITTRKHLTDEMESIFENSLVGIFHINPAGEIVRCNECGIEMTGYSEEDLLGSTGDFLHISKENYKKLLRKLTHVLAGKDLVKLEYPFINKTGKVFWCLLSARAINPQDPERGIVIIAEDITEQKQLEEQLRNLSKTDPLTNIYNRRGFEEYLNKEIKQTKRYGRPLSLILLDIDHLKAINDLHGHDVGDLTIQEITNIIKREKREVDIPCRWGGEEFAILLPDTPVENALILAERLRAAIEKHSIPALGKATISLGVTQFHDKQDTVESFFKRTDDALYKAKREGRNRTEMLLFSSDL